MHLVTRLLQPQLAFDRTRHRHHHPQRMRIGQPAVAADIQHSQDLTRAIHDGRSRTHQELILLPEMLPRVDLHRAPLHQCRADGVGSLLRFTPRRSRAELHLAGPRQDAPVPNRIQQHSLFIGQNHLEVRAAQDSAQVLHERPGHADQIGFVLQPLVKHRLVLTFSIRLGRRRDLQLPASLPRLRHGGPHDAAVDQVVLDVLLPRLPSQDKALLGHTFSHRQA
jgi:hypothetical protein